MDHSIRSDCKFAQFANDAETQKEFLAIKQENKRALINTSVKKTQFAMAKAKSSLTILRWMNPLFLMFRSKGSMNINGS